MRLFSGPAYVYFEDVPIRVYASMLSKDQPLEGARKLVSNYKCPHGHNEDEVPCSICSRFRKLEKQIKDLKAAAMHLSGVARTLNKHIEILESIAGQEVARSSLPANYDVDVLYPAQNKVIELCREET